MNDQTLAPESRATLSDGRKIPLIGFGTYQIKGELAYSSTLGALQAGYRHLDTAQVYKNEAEVGRALRDSGVDRDEVWVTTKLWPGGLGNQQCLGYADALAACEASLTALGLGCVDLLLIHGPFARDERVSQYKALLEMQKRGKARSVGVSNYGIAHLEEIRLAGLPTPACNQIELHPLCTRTDLRSYMRQHGIFAVAYSSLAPLPTWRKGQQGGRSVPDEDDMGGHIAAKLSTAAQAHGLSVAQLLLRWGLDMGFAILPKSVSAARIKENRDLFGHGAALSAEELRSIAKLDRGQPLAFGRGFDPCACD